MSTQKVSSNMIASLEASKLTGSLPAIDGSNLTGVATDMSGIRADILRLALHQAVDGNRAAFSLEDSFVDAFENDSGIASETGTDRNESEEYVSTAIQSVGQFSSDSNTVLLLHMDDTGLTDSSSNNHSMTVGGNAARSNTQSKFGNYSMYCAGGGDDFLTAPANMYNIGTGDFTIEGWFYWTSFVNNSGMFDWSAWGSNQYDFLIRANNDTQGGQPNWEIGIYGGGGSYPDRYAHENTTPRVTTNTWTHICVERHAGTVRMYKDGESKAWEASGNGFTGDYNFVTSGAMRIGRSHWNIHNGYIDEVRFSNVARYQGTNFTPNSIMVPNASGTVISTTQTASSSRSSCSGVILYEDGQGTGTLGTDLKIYFTADNGANWTEASSYGTATTYDTTKKLVRLGSTNVPAGTQIAMKAEWANQVQGQAGVSDWETGNRNINITGSHAVNDGNYLNWKDGDTTASGSRAWYWQHGMTVDSSHWVKLDFDAIDGGTGATRIITEFRYHTSGESDSGVWKWQGSNDDTNWTDIGSNWTMTMNSGWNTFSNTINNNTTAYRYYRILGVSGSTTAPWMTEIEFKILQQAAVAGKETRLHGWAVNY